VDTGFVKKKCDNKGVERGFDPTKICIAPADLIDGFCHQSGQQNQTSLRQTG